MSEISTTVPTTSVRTEGFVWMESTLTTADASLSGQVGAGVTPPG